MTVAVIHGNIWGLGRGRRRLGGCITHIQGRGACCRGAFRDLGRLHGVDILRLRLRCARAFSAGSSFGRLTLGVRQRDGGSHRSRGTLAGAGPLLPGTSLWWCHGKKVVDDAGRRSSVAECGGSRKVWWWRVRSRSGGRLRDEGGEIGRSLRRTLRRDSNPQLHRSWIPSLG